MIDLSWLSQIITVQQLQNALMPQQYHTMATMDGSGAGATSASGTPIKATYVMSPPQMQQQQVINLQGVPQQFFQTVQGPGNSMFQVYIYILLINNP